MMQNNGCFEGKLVVGLTGGSGAGKSTVSDVWRKNGAFIADCDKIAREIVQPNMPALAEIEKQFDGVIMSDGTLDRKKLGSIVFADSEALKRLNEITHKYITERIVRLIGENTADVYVIDGAVLFESGLAKECGVMCAVLADNDVRVDRIIARDNISREQAQKRINSQAENSFFEKSCDYIIYNNGQLEQTVRDAERVLAEIKLRIK